MTLKQSRIQGERFSAFRASDNLEGLKSVGWRRGLLGKSLDFRVRPVKFDDRDVFRRLLASRVFVWPIDSRHPFSTSIGSVSFTNQ